MDLQLPMQSVPITTKVVSSNPAHGEMYSIQHYVVTFVSGLRKDVDFHQVLRLHPPGKIDSHDVTEILLKVALKTITS